MTLGSRIYAAPIKDHPNLQRILDAGTGTGVWAMDIGKLTNMPNIVHVVILTANQVMNFPKQK